MEENTFVHYLLSGQSSEQFLAAFIQGLIGMMGSVIIQAIYFKEKIKSTGGFRIIKWLEDNFLRSLLSILIILVGASQGQAITGYVSTFGCIGLGFMTDKVIEALLKFKVGFKFNFNKKSE